MNIVRKEIRIEKKRVLIVGGYGFLGLAIVRAFLKVPEWNIIMTDHERKEQEVLYVMSNSRVSYINESKLRSDEDNSKSPIICELVIHCETIFDQIWDLNQRVATRKHIFLCSSYTRLEVQLINEITTLYSSGKEQMIYVPRLFGIFDSIENPLPYLILMKLLKKCGVITIDPEVIYEWLYIDDATNQIKDIVLEESNRCYCLKGDRYSFNEIEKLLDGYFNESEIGTRFRKNTNKTGLKREENQRPNQGTIYRYNRYESFQERLVQTIEFYEDNVTYYQKQLENLGVSRDVN